MKISRYTLAEEPHTNTPSLGWFVYRSYEQWPVSENRYRSAALAAIRRHQRADAKAKTARGEVAQGV